MGGCPLRRGRAGDAQAGQVFESDGAGVMIEGSLGGAVAAPAGVEVAGGTAEITHDTPVDTSSVAAAKALARTQRGTDIQIDGVPAAS